MTLVARMQTGSDSLARLEGVESASASALLDDASGALTERPANAFSVLGENGSTDAHWWYGESNVALAVDVDVDVDGE